MRDDARAIATLVQNVQKMSSMWQIMTKRFKTLIVKAKGGRYLSIGGG